MKDTMARLQTSQLQCQILKHQGDIETAAKIQKNLVCILIFSFSFTLTN